MPPVAAHFLSSFLANAARVGTEAHPEQLEISMSCNIVLISGNEELDRDKSSGESRRRRARMRQNSTPNKK